MAFKEKVCKTCKLKFIPDRPLQYLCSWNCASSYAKKQIIKKEKINLIEKKKDLLTHKDYLKMLQIAFNTYIRKRDEGKPCISCNNILRGKFDAGHFYSVGGYPNVRFNEINVWGQCVHCNQHRHGNIHEYAKRLINLIGHKSFNDLEIEAHQKSNKLTIEEIKEKIKYYKLKTKQLEKI